MHNIFKMKGENGQNMIFCIYCIKGNNPCLKWQVCSRVNFFVHFCWAILHQSFFMCYWRNCFRLSFARVIVVQFDLEWSHWSLSVWLKDALILLFLRTSFTSLLYHTSCKQQCDICQLRRKFYCWKLGCLCS